MLVICQCQVEWGMKSAGTVTIRGFDNFSRCKSREGGHPVRYGGTLKLLVEDDHTRLTHVTLRGTRSVNRNQWGYKTQEFKVLGPLRVS